MKIASLILAAAFLALLAYVRLAPSDATRWHIDPTTAADPGSTGVLIAPGKFVSTDTTIILLEKFDAIAREHSAATRLAGTVNDSHITYVVRSKWFGFPDYLTIKTIPTDIGGSTLSILSRSRFGQSDLGVNRARLDAWLEAIESLAP
jgi:uncharacterized protein (DUF1499 family)